MEIDIGKDKTARLDAVRREFNAFTGKRLTVEQFAAYLLGEALQIEEGAAAMVGRLRGESLRLYTTKYAAKGVRNVH